MRREEDLYDIWEEFCRQGSWTADFQLRGIYAGQLNRFAGPDFQGAEFEFDGKICRGDVEIHLRTNDWYEHYHHLDRNYDLVMLHLVFDESRQISVYNSKMREIHTIGFKQFPQELKPKKRKYQCADIKKDPDEIEHRLKKLALDRLHSKELGIRKNSEKDPYDQVIFRQLMKVFGKPYNEQTFQLLASIFPWDYLMAIRDRFKLTPEHWLAFFAVKSGLIESTPEFSLLKPLTDRVEAINCKPGLEATMWCPAGQRPNNRPSHHLKILSYWLHGFEGQSLYHLFKTKLRERIPYPLMLIELENIFKIDLPGSKNKNFRVDSKIKTLKWGRSQIIELIGNVIIPFFHWEAARQSSLGFQSYLQSLYFFLPQSTPYAKLKPLYKRMPEYKNRFNRFYMNQGLLTLKDKFCDRRGCQACPLIVDYKDIDKNL